MQRSGVSNRLFAIHRVDKVGNPLPVECHPWCWHRAGMPHKCFERGATSSFDQMAADPAELPRRWIRHRPENGNLRSMMYQQRPPKPGQAQVGHKPAPPVTPRV
jgi:hypothetical protein